MSNKKTNKNNFKNDLVEPLQSDEKTELNDNVEMTEYHGNTTSNSRKPFLGELHPTYSLDTDKMPSVGDVIKITTDTKVITGIVMDSETDSTTVLLKQLDSNIK